MTETLKIGDQEYKTVKIGDQLWMAENLKVTHYRNGNEIPKPQWDDEWKDAKTGAFCPYDNEETHVDVYGYLYNWNVVNDRRNIAPTGWHVPGDDEWQTICDFLDGTHVAGGKMKEVFHWDSPNVSASNESGFSGLPGGFRAHFGFFCGIFCTALFWSSTEANSDQAWTRALGYTNPGVDRSCTSKQYGCSIRLIRDN